MTYLFYSSSSLAYPHFGVQLHQALKMREEGHRVVFAYCDGVIDICFKNIHASPFICQACKFGYNSTLNIYKDKFEIVKLKKFRKSINHSFSFSGIEDIKNIKYRGVEVGYSVLAYYISLTRNPELNLTPEEIIYINNILCQTCALVDSAFSLIDQVNPDCVSIFNGRFFESKPFYECAKLRNIDVIINEVIGTGLENSPIYITDYVNALPHDIPYFVQKIRHTWYNSPFSEDIKLEMGQTFFINKRNGIDTALINYTKDQSLGLLPITWDWSKKNVVIFNSSEDEYASIGTEFSSYAMFHSQLEGIHFILKESFSSDFHFYIRIHPNLKDILLPFHQDLLELGNLYGNCTVISSEDKVSTYTLIDACWKVVVFGSTVGLESVFWGKPAILLTGSMYHDLNALYKPKSKIELIDLLSRDLELGDTLPAIMFGYYFMDREVSYQRPKLFDLDLEEYKFFKWRFLQPRYQTFFRSTLFFKLIIIFYLKFKYRLFPKTKFYYNK